jgi:iron complex transport system permease protein
MTQPFTVRLRSLSFRLDQRVPMTLIGLSIVIILGIILSTAQGEYPISILDVVKTLVGINTGNPDHVFVIYTLRLSRVLTAALVGMAMAIAGTITQGITRNALASPGIVGVNAGAALAAVTVIILFPALSVAVLPVAAFLGGTIAALLIYLLSWQGGSAPVRLILIGVGVNLIAGAFTEVLTTFGDVSSVSQALVWLAGSVYGRRWEQIAAFLPWLLGFGTLALWRSRELNTLNLGDEVARSLGSRVEWQRGLLLLTSVALAGASVATAGSIGFVDLMAPHVARQLVGPSHEGLLPTAALVGSAIVVFADLLGRVLFAPIEIPCGLVTSAIGAPYFIYLLIRQRKQQGGATV